MRFRRLTQFSVFEEYRRKSVADPRPALAGAIVVDSDRQIVFAEGVGADTRVKSLIQDTEWMSELRKRRMRALTLDRETYALTLIPHNKSDILLIHGVDDSAVVDFISSVDFAFDILSHLIAHPHEAMTVVDAKGKLVFISPVHEQFFGIERGAGRGKHVRDVIENTRLDRVLATGKPEIAEIQKMRGHERVVSRVPVRRGDEVVGAFGRVMFTAPGKVEELAKRINTLESEVQFYRREAAALRSSTYGLESLVGSSPAMQRLRADITRVAPLEIPIHIRGESGTGKELVAQSIHRLSPRRDTPMVMVNSAALPPTLVEAELFGYEPGAFTGADRKGRKGKFEMADNGTIFLDEIGDTPMDIQVKLLRVLQDRRIERIGGQGGQEVDFRLVSATNRDLRTLISEGKFRLDLYYRISAIIIDMPPLRQRIDDIPDLVKHILEELCMRHRRPIPTVTPDALSYLMDQRWPGNVRQLRQEIERALVFSEDGRIDAALLTLHSDLEAPGDNGFDFADEPERKAAPEPIRPLKEAVESLESRLVQDAMKRFKGNKKRVSEELGISRSYLYKILGEAETTP
jgi:transcriptional regulator with PAS, ATPase and Fis domain